MILSLERGTEFLIVDHPAILSAAIRAPSMVAPLTTAAGAALHKISPVDRFHASDAPPLSRYFLPLVPRATSHAPRTTAPAPITGTLNANHVGSLPTVCMSLSTRIR